VCGSYPENPFYQNEIRRGERKLSVGETGREKGVAEWSVGKSEERRSLVRQKERNALQTEREAEKVLFVRQRERNGVILFKMSLGCSLDVVKCILC